MKNQLKLSRKEVSGIVECPDCFGHGNISTPAKNWNRRVICATCNGNGFVRRLSEEAGGNGVKEKS